MTGIAGIQGSNKGETVHAMLSRITHRSKKHSVIFLKNGLTIGIATNDLDKICNYGKDGSTFLINDYEDSTSVSMVNEHIVLKRDKYGVAPLYYVVLEDNSIAFASEIKSLVMFNKEIKELLPGFTLQDLQLKKYYALIKEEEIKASCDEFSISLKNVLQTSIQKRLKDDVTGAWLSGGLDSSAISALVAPMVKRLHTFAVGFPGAPDLHYAKIVAGHIGSIHHERFISFEDIIKVLPKTIYHLESFDSLLVRSSVMNYLVAQLCSEYVEEVFSGEGGDELFAGYEYIKNIPKNKIADELIDITNRLHNTALQRVDRCSSAFGVTAHVPFMDEDVVNLAVRIPTEFKLHGDTEKWILRLAVANDLPGDALNRKKSKFWEGSGMEEHFYNYAEGLITDSDFRNEKEIKCGWKLVSKEELMYYRIFKEHFGEMDNLDWMGRTKPIKTVNKIE
jgi:asparagine synthase (glutamine-hydrolysing)